MGTQTKILLDETEMPTKWYNIVADLPEPPPPPLHPGTHQPATGEDFDAFFSDVDVTKIKDLIKSSTQMILMQSKY